MRTVHKKNYILFNYLYLKTRELFDTHNKKENKNKSAAAELLKRITETLYNYAAINYSELYRITAYIFLDLVE